MAIIENSVFCRIWLTLWAALVRLWPDSLLGRVCARLGAPLRRWVGGSVLCQVAAREGRLDRAWPDSLSCRLLAGIVNLPCALVRTIYRAAPRLWDGSLLCRLVGGLGRSAATLLGLLVLVMLVVPHQYWNNVYGFLGAMAIAALFILGAGSGRTRLETDRTGPYLLFFYTFVCTAFVGSLSVELSLRFFLFHLTGLCFALLMVSAVDRVEHVQRAAAAGVTGLLVASLYGCWQGIQGVPVVASQQDAYLNVGMPGRVYSFFDNPNNFAEVVVLFLPLALALLLNARTWRGRLASLVCLGAGLAAIGYTMSRSGWLGLALAVFVFLALQNWRVVPFALAAAVLAIPLLPDTILNRLRTIGDMRDTSTLYRFAIYGATGTLLEDYWFQGVGLGSDVMTQAFKAYPTMFDGNHPIHTHNNYLQMFGELGFFGGLAYLALVLNQVKRGVRAFYAAENRRVRHLLAAAVGAFCGILLIGVAEYTWFYPRTMFMFWFLFGIIGACVKLVKKEARS